MQSSRRIFFNPTSLPHLRTSRYQTRGIFNGGAHIPRPGLRIGSYNNVYSSGRVNGVRRQSNQTGENNTGHISAGPNEGILFFDNIFPVKFNWILRLPWVGEQSLPELVWKFNHQRLAAWEPLTYVKRAIPESVPIKVTEILPRLKDGGAFVKFSHDEGITTQEIEGLLKTYLREKPIKPWFSPFRRIRTNLVIGKPWLEDLARFPSSRIKVEFVPVTPGAEAVELSQETLYSLFRRYGKLAEISSQPSDSKVLPKYAFIDFSRLRNSVIARNCMHNFVVPEATGGGKAGTVLRLTYEPKMKAHWIRDWIVGHPRIVIPAVAALVATITVAVFDPIRTFFIKAHIDHTFNLKNTKFYKWFKNQTTDMFRLRKSEEVSLHAIWSDRREAIDQLRSWLMETTNTFIVIQGPRGAGKKELVMDQALRDRPNTLLIDCKPIAEARGDSATINATAVQVGYRPVFSWMNSISSLADLAVQGTIGVKSGFSETLDTQLANIMQTTATALQEIALSHRKKDDADANLGNDEWLEAHPEFQPVVIIDNFLHKNEERGVVYDKLSEWAAGLTTSNVAHVIFLTTDTSYTKSLSKALPDRVFRQISLGDISHEVAKKFVITHLQQDPEGDSEDTKKLSQRKFQEDLAELDECVAVLGGRLTDLEFFARRLRTGQNPKHAMSEIIEQNASEVIKMYLLNTDSGPDRKWSSEQAWLLIKSLAKQESLRYNEVLLSNTFSSSLTPSASNGEGVLEALSAAELITIKNYKGRPQEITAGKPVYQAAFKVLTEDNVLRSRLDLALLTELTKIENKSIDKYETELHMLGELPKQPREIASRIQYLLGKIMASQVKVEAWEKEMGVLKKVLTSEY
ncbi:escape protein-like protein 2 [Xylogone sp. PMI_703]|nr:escape protein-like protein 2 [Xylogone sp. PMI_703]